MLLLHMWGRPGTKTNPLNFTCMLVLFIDLLSHSLPFPPLSSSPYLFTSLQPSSLLAKTVTVSKVPAESTGLLELREDDLAGKMQNEYDPMIPNNYELIMRQKRAEERSRDSEVSML